MPLRKEQYADKEKLRVTRNAQRKRYYNKTAILYSGYPLRRWTEYEQSLLFNNIMTDRELSKLICRTVKAIQGKRSAILKKQRLEKAK